MVSTATPPVRANSSIRYSMSNRSHGTCPPAPGTAQGIPSPAVIVVWAEGPPGPGPASREPIFTPPDFLSPPGLGCRASAPSSSARSALGVPVVVALQPGRVAPDGRRQVDDGVHVAVVVVVAVDGPGHVQRGPGKAGQV